MSNILFGKIIEGEAHKDATHVATAPVVSNETLYPAQHVGLIANSTTEVSSLAAKLIGIIDPFLRGSVPPGSKVWLFLYPQTVTGMRHEWQHPAFKEEHSAEREESVQWLTEFAKNAPDTMTFKEILVAADNWIQNGDPMCFGYDIDEYVDETFWMHFERATGILVPQDKRTNFFRCAC